MTDDDDGGEELPEQVDAERARALIAGGEVRVIDVRSAEDFAEERITGAVHCDPDEIESVVDQDDPGGRDAVLIVCGDGSRSAELAEELRGGDRQVTSIEGGFDAWVGEHLPTAPNPDAEYEGPKVTLPGAVAQSKPPEDEEDEDEEEAEKAEDA